MDYLKRYLIILLFLLLASTADAKNYYISSLIGNDAYTSTQAQSPSTPWQTLAKINSFFVNLNPGDSVLFRRGETFYGSLLVTNSGSPVLPIVVSAYGIGAKPIVSGFTTLSAWTSLDGNIYESPCAAFSANGNMVIVNGVQQSIGRYPNTGYLKIDAHSGTSSISSQSLSGGPNWKGAEVVIRKTRWVIDRNEILTQSGNTLTYKSSSNYTPLDGFGYFIQKSAKTLDQLGEWYLDPIGKKMQMYFGKNVPNSYQVKVATVDTLVNIRGNNNINFENISFQGSNVSTFMLNNANNVSIRGCDINFSGTNAITGTSTSTHVTIENTTINHTNNDAIELDWQCTNTTIRNNTIKNTGLFAGLGLDGDGGGGAIGSGYGSYSAIVCIGSNVSIEGNQIDSIGYNGIRFHGNAVSIKNNLVSNFCLTKDDGAGIYEYGEKNGIVSSDRKILNNLALNGIGNGEGTDDPNSRAADGIYMDDNTSNVEIAGNTVSNCTKGIYLHNAHEIQLSYNTLYNNYIQLYLSEDNGNDLIRNIEFTDNVVFSKDGSQLATELLSEANDIKSFGFFDNNAYASPFQQNPIFVTEVNAEIPLFQALNFQEWQSAYNQDAKSITSSINIPSYSLKGLVGTNKYGYGTFEGRNDIPWISSYSTDGKAVGFYDGTKKIDGNGSLKISYSSSTLAKSELTVGNIGAVSISKNYILKFSTLGLTNDRTIGICLRKGSTPYTALTPVQYITLPAIRSDHEVLFSFPVADPTANIVFQLNGGDGTLWLDNLEFYEANATVVNPNDLIRFEYNATNAVKTVNLDRIYTDAKNTRYQTKLTLAPYSSTVLIAVGDAPVKLSQTLNFPSISDKTLGTAPFSLGATSSSGLPVFYRILSGNGTLNDSTLTLTGAGTLSIEASQPGNLTYNPAPPLTQTITIKEANQSLQVILPARITFGDPPFELGATASSGLAITYKVLSGPATISGNKVTLLGAGKVSIEASQFGNENQKVASVVQDFVVNKSKQTIYFSPIATKKFSDQPFSITATSSANLPVTCKILSGSSGVISENIITIIGVGDVLVEATQAGNDNFETAAAVDQTFTINKAVPNLKFDALPNKMESDVSFNLIAESNDPSPISFSSSNPSIVGVSNKTGQWIATLNRSGIAIITASQLADDRYNEISVSQSLLIKPTSGGPQDKIQFTTFPNPFTSRLNIQFTPIESAPANLIVYDLQGTVVKVLFKGQVVVGALMSFVLESTGLKTGVYIVRLTIANHNLIKKVLFTQT